MGEEKNTLTEQRPAEVVECYTRPVYPEVVETYARPLPWAEVLEKPAGCRKRKRGLWIFLLCLAVVLVAAVCGWFWGQSQMEPPGEEFPSMGEGQAITIPVFPRDESVELTLHRARSRQLSAGEIYQSVNPSVVTVMTQVEDGLSVGTGVIFRPDGYILTNHHVLAGGTDCSIALSSGRSYAAQYVAGDENNDLAILKVELQDLPAAEFGNSDDLAVGDRVYAIGNPLGVELRGTLTDGIVSAINRDVKVSDRTMTLIQTNAALNSGNSGGPLINSAGQVVGINTIKMSSTYSSVEGLGFAIPSTTLRTMVKDLMTFGEVQPDPELGVLVSRLGSQLSDGSWGIEVLQVNPNSAAEAAGIQKGDVLVAASGRAVDSSQSLMQILRQYRPGDQIDLVLWRDGTRVTVTAELKEAAEP